MGMERSSIRINPISFLLKGISQHTSSQSFHLLQAVELTRQRIDVPLPGRYDLTSSLLSFYRSTQAGCIFLMHIVLEVVLVISGLFNGRDRLHEDIRVAVCILESNWIASLLHCSFLNRCLFRVLQCQFRLTSLHFDHSHVFVLVFGGWIYLRRFSQLLGPYVAQLALGLLPRAGPVSNHTTSSASGDRTSRQ